MMMIIFKSHIIWNPIHKKKKETLHLDTLTSDLPLAIQLDMLCGFNFIESNYYGCGKKGEQIENEN